MIFERKFGEDYENAFKLEEDVWDYLNKKYDHRIDIVSISKEEIV